MNLTDDLIFGYLQPTDLLNLAGSALRRHFGSLAKAIVAPLLVSCTAILCYFAIALPTFFVTRHGNDTNRQLLDVLIGGVGGFFLMIAILAGSLGYASGLICRMVTLELLGKQPVFRTVEREVNAKLGRIMVTVFLSLLPVSLYLIAALGLTILPGVVESTSQDTLLGLLTIIGSLMLFAALILIPALLIRPAVAVPALLEEDLSPLAAARRSKNLTRGKTSDMASRLIMNLWSVGILLIMAAWIGLASVLSMFDVESWFRPLTANDWLQPVAAFVLTAAPIFLAIALFVVFWCSAISALYVERRMRMEGLDYQILKRRAEDDQKRSRFRV